jgi:formylmethanofuran dehydrogenase subunit E-like metal-binding protein
LRWDTHTNTQTHGQQGDLKSILQFFQKKESKLKMTTMMTVMVMMTSVCDGFGWMSRDDVTEEQLEQTAYYRDRGTDLYSGGALFESRL